MVIHQTLMLTRTYFFILLLSISLISCYQGTSDYARFELLNSELSGVNFVNQLTENDSINAYNYLYIYNGSGVGIADFNNDGLQDIFFGGNMTSSKLYINKGELKFEDLTQESGLITERWIHGISVVDINSDGFLDIYLSVGGMEIGQSSENMLFINNGDLTFSEQSSQYGLNESKLTTHTAFFDYDKDGDLDAYLINYENNPQKDPTAVRRKKYDGKSISNDRLYRNDNGRFVDVSSYAGINQEGYGLGLAINDFNHDGWPDIYVSNDFTFDDYLYINNQDGTFSDNIKEYVKHTSNFGMGVDIADINNDGHSDMFQVDMLPEDNRRQKKLLSGLNYDRFQLLTNTGYIPQYMRNSLQLNSGESTFNEIGLLSGMSSTDWSWAPLIADLDNNGNKDVFITNGYVKDVTDVDFRDFVISENQKRNAVFDPNVVISALRDLKGEMVSNYAYSNSGNLEFSNQSENWGLNQPSFSTGASYGDLDNDGDLDLVVSNLNHTSFIYENKSSQIDSLSYLMLDLTVDGDFSKAIGTKVNLTINGETYSSQVYPYRGFQSTVDARLHFGLGRHQKVDVLEVFWPDNTKTIKESVSVNQIISIDRSTAKIEEVNEKDLAPAIFRKPNELISLDYNHKESFFVDFNREALLPHKLSQEGPSSAKGDVNNDGLMDFFVGGAAGESGKIFIQSQSGVSSTFTELVLDNSASEDAGSIFFDIDLDGDQDLYVVSGSNEFEIGSDLYKDRLYLNDGNGNFTESENLLDYEAGSSSVITKNDFDNDGDFDLFIGGRCLPGQYPKPGRSMLLANVNGVFKDVTAELAPDLENVGMVKDAEWADINGDGSKELVITGEFMTIKVFRKANGKFLDVTSSHDLSAYVGWWNAIEIVDVDGDGDMDIIGGNLGLNSRYKGTTEEPLTLYADDFNRDGRLDPIIAYYNAGEEYIIHDRITLSQQINSIKKKFVTNLSYAEATVVDVLGKELLDKALTLRANHFKTSLFINDGTGSFEYKELPIEVQFSQVNDIQVLDFDNDGVLDLLFGGNSFSPEVFNGRYDAQSAIALKGLGNGNYLPLSQSQSGLENDGVVTSIETLNLNGEQFVLLLKNNDKAELLQVSMDNKNLKGGY